MSTKKSLLASVLEQRKQKTEKEKGHAAPRPKGIPVIPEPEKPKTYRQLWWSWAKATGSLFANRYFMLTALGLFAVGYIYSGLVMLAVQGFLQWIIDLKK